MAVPAAVSTALIAYVMRAGREFEIAREGRNRYRNPIDVLTSHSDPEFRVKLVSPRPILKDPEQNAVRDSPRTAFFIKNATERVLSS